MLEMRKRHSRDSRLAQVYQLISIGWFMVCRLSWFPILKTHSHPFNSQILTEPMSYTWVYSDPIQSTSVSVSSVTQSCLTLCSPMNRSTPGLPVHHQLPESTQTHVHWVGNAIQPSHPLSSPSPPAPSPSQHQGLFKWVSSLHQVAKVLEFKLQHQSFQWTPRTDLL